MVDVRQKGATAETKAKEELRKLTGLKWERIPMSGALDAKHGLKGDLYVPGEGNIFCVEIKHYKECHIDHSLITGKNPQLIQWWEQTLRESNEINKEPLLIFKHDRSKFYCAFKDLPAADFPYIFVNKDGHEFYIAVLEDFVKNNKPRFIK